jgi:hypothetical protein
MANFFSKLSDAYKNMNPEVKQGISEFMSVVINTSVAIVVSILTKKMIEKDKDTVNK